MLRGSGVGLACGRSAGAAGWPHGACRSGPAGPPLECLRAWGGFRLRARAPDQTAGCDVGCLLARRYAPGDGSQPHASRHGYACELTSCHDVTYEALR
jgi:hypothetical protein